MTTTTVSEWREKREAGVEIQLPDYGDVIKIRPMDAEFFFRTGRIPDFLSETVRQMLSGQEFTLQPPGVEAQKTQEWLDWLNDLIRWTMVSPKVVEIPRESENEISIDEISYIDKLYIFGHFGRPAVHLRTFRKKQIELMASVDAAKNNGANAEHVVEGAGVGGSDTGNA